MSMTPEEILNFWFSEVGPARWFDEDLALDKLIHERFLSAHGEAVKGDLRKWEETPESMLALLLLIDQFPLRMFRGTPRAYESLDLAVDLARTAIIKHFDDRIDKVYKLLFYLPFQHSERMGDQRLALFYIRERTKEEDWVRTVEKSYDVIARFGRFPERNEILGRDSTPEEKAYLGRFEKT